MAEVGGSKKGYHRCERQAKWSRLTSHGTLMCYCEQHKRRAFHPRSEYYTPAPNSKPEAL